MDKVLAAGIDYDAIGEAFMVLWDRYGAPGSAMNVWAIIAHASGLVRPERATGFERLASFDMGALLRALGKALPSDIMQHIIERVCGGQPFANDATPEDARTHVEAAMRESFEKYLEQVLEPQDFAEYHRFRRLAPYLCDAPPDLWGMI